MQTVKFQSASADSDPSREETGDTPDLHPMDVEKPLPLRDLLARPVLVSVANYATIALLGMISAALMPLIWSTSIEFGGLDLSPPSIGLWLSVYGCINGIFQFAVFPRAVKRFDLRSIFATSIGVFAIVYILFPLENLTLRRADDSPAWLLILLQLTGLSISTMGYSKLLCDSSVCAPTLITGMCQAPRSCISVPRPPTNDRLAQRMVLHSPWRQYSAQSHQPSQTGFSHSRLRIMSWVGTLSMLFFLPWCVLGCMLRRSFRGTCGSVMLGGYH